MPSRAEMGIRAEAAWPILIEETRRVGEAGMIAGLSVVVVCVAAIVVCAVLQRRDGQFSAWWCGCVVGAVMGVFAVVITSCGALPMYLSPNLYLVERIFR